MPWDAALQQHERWLRTVVYSRVGEAQAVDDVMQEVALAIAGRPDRPVVPERMAPWLYRVAVRQALLYRRKAGRRRRLLDRYGQRTGAGVAQVRADDPLDWLLAQERCSLLRSALQQLPMRDAQILRLKYSEDWTYQQIASHLGLSVRAVEARLHRARKRLRLALAAIEHDKREPSDVGRTGK